MTSTAYHAPTNVIRFPIERARQLEVNLDTVAAGLDSQIARLREAVRRQGPELASGAGASPLQIEARLGGATAGLNPLPLFDEPTLRLVAFEGQIDELRAAVSRQPRFERTLPSEEGCSPLGG